MIYKTMTTKTGMRGIGKKGELTSEQIVVIVIALIGFGIIALLYTQLNWGGNVNKQVCHESVILRGSIDFASGIAQNAVPLKCQTEKLCVTGSSFGGKCDDFDKTKGVTYARVSDKNGIEKVISQSAVECWNMMGEGYLSLFQQTPSALGIGGVYPTCVICSRIAYDKNSLNNKGINLNDVNVAEYMQTRLMKDKNITYWQYFSKGNDVALSVPSSFKFSELSELQGTNTIPSLDADNKVSAELANPAVPSGNVQDELAVIYMQVSAPSHSDVIKNTISLVAGGTALSGGAYLAMPKVVKGVSGKAGSAVVRSPWTWIVLAVVGAVQQANVAHNQLITAGYCGDLKSGNSAREGCSAVRVVPFNVTEIKQYCLNIESIS